MQSLIISCFCIILALLSHNANSSETAVSVPAAVIEQPGGNTASAEPQAANGSAVVRKTNEVEAKSRQPSSGGIALEWTISTYGIVGAAFLLLMILSRHGRIHHQHGHQHA